MTKWTNYETERVFIDFFEGVLPRSTRLWTGDTPENLRDYVLDSVIAQTKPGFGRYYATLFVGEVDWLQISLHLTERESAA